MSELKVILETEKLYRGVFKITEKLPSNRRVVLGRRAEDVLLNLMEYLIMAKSAPKAMKGAYLLKASALTEMIQFYLKIFLEEKLANETTLFQLQAKTVEIGRQIGGWRKSVQ